MPHLKPASCVGLFSLVVSASALAQAPAQPSDGLEEVIVRGEKIDRSLQETPTSVAVTTARRIEEENLLRLQDVYERTANVSETYGASGFTIRGISNGGVTASGNAPLATVYLDGAPLPTSVLYGAPTNLWDISQVEILRGPQSTLQGLNTLAGAVILRSTDPGATWNGRARIWLTDEQEQIYSLAVGGPVAGDELGVRLAVEKRDADGFIRNTTRRTGEDSTDSLNVRGVVKWTPSALPDFDARLSYVSAKHEGGYMFTYVDTTVPDFLHHRTNASDTPNTGDVDLDIATLELGYRFTDKLRLQSITSWSDATERTEYDNDFTPLPIAFGTQGRDYTTWSQELRLAFEGKRLNGLLGAYYYHRDQTFTNDSLTNVPTPLDTISAVLQGNGLDAATATYVAGLYGQALPAIMVDYDSRSDMSVKTYALFGDGRWQWTDRLSLVAGFRWDHETNRTETGATSQFAGTYPDPGNFGAPGDPLWFAIAGINQAVAQFVAQAGAVTPPSKRTFDAFLPKLGLDYAFTKDLSAAFVVQRAYRSGGSSENIARAIVVPYDPEYAWNYELSMRSQWLDRRLTLNANVFYLDWKDQQVAVNFGLNTYDVHTVNAGSSHVYGAEVELVQQVTPILDWYASVGHTKTKFDEFDVTLGSTTDLSGRQFAYAPRWTLGTGVNLRLGNGFSANVNVNYRGSVFTDVLTAQNDWRVDSRTLVNARVGYETQYWAVNLFANNLFDEQYIQYDLHTRGAALLGAPRVVGVTLEARF
ncbi:MAG: TonB-dependent receptor [Steroidobacteraceae bacterium]